MKVILAALAVSVALSMAVTAQLSTIQDDGIVNALQDERISQLSIAVQENRADIADLTRLVAGLTVRIDGATNTLTLLGFGFGTFISIMQIAQFWQMWQNKQGRT